jgi:hypothetical protein
MSVVVYVIDTSYLVELFGCGRFSNQAASKAVRERFKSANKTGGRFFVPLPCLFELGDHVADVGHDDLRAKLAKQLAETVRDSLISNKPWTITPTGSPGSILPALMERFEPLASKQKVGLVDTFTLCEAVRLKQSLQAFKARVHIWTNDRSLKGQEPDCKPDPYLW